MEEEKQGKSPLHIKWSPLNFCNKHFPLNKNTTFFPYLLSLLVFFLSSCSLVSFLCKVSGATPLKAPSAPSLPGSSLLSHTECPWLLKWCSLCGVQGSCLLAWRKPCWVLSRPGRGRRALHPNLSPASPLPWTGHFHPLSGGQWADPQRGRRAPTNNDMHDSHCVTPMGGSRLVEVGGTRECRAAYLRMVILSNSN